MQVLRAVREDEVIGAYLRAELDSSRYGDNLRALLAGQSDTLLREPDFADEDANARRRQLLELHRGYVSRSGMFVGFPSEVDWFRVALAPEEVLDILFLNSDWWLWLSGGSRRPRDTAHLIRAGGAGRACRGRARTRPPSR